MWIEEGCYIYTTKYKINIYTKYITTRLSLFRYRVFAESPRRFAPPTETSENLPMVQIISQIPCLIWKIL